MLIRCRELGSYQGRQTGTCWRTREYDRSQTSEKQLYIQGNKQTLECRIVRSLFFETERRKLRSDFQCIGKLRQNKIGTKNYRMTLDHVFIPILDTLIAFNFLHFHFRNPALIKMTNQIWVPNRVWNEPGNSVVNQFGKSIRIHFSGDKTFGKTENSFVVIAICKHVP